MVPPRNVVLEIRDQLIRRSELVDHLFSIEVPVISFVSLVVVAQITFSAYDIRQPVLVSVWIPFHRFWKLLQYQT